MFACFLSSFKTSVKNCPKNEPLSVSSGIPYPMLRTPKANGILTIGINECLTIETERLTTKGTPSLRHILSFPFIPDKAHRKAVIGETSKAHHPTKIADKPPT